jgi:hypothetical protein
MAGKPRNLVTFERAIKISFSPEKVGDCWENDPAASNCLPALSRAERRSLEGTLRLGAFRPESARGDRIPYIRAYRLEDWLDLHGMTVAACQAVLSPAPTVDVSNDGLGRCDISGDTAWYVAADAMTSSFPFTAPLIARVRDHATRDFSPDGTGLASPSPSRPTRTAWRRCTLVLAGGRSTCSQWRTSSGTQCRSPRPGADSCGCSTVACGKRVHENSTFHRRIRGYTINRYKVTLSKTRMRCICTDVVPNLRQTCSSSCTSFVGTDAGATN